jgi:hypothetical protein
MAPETAAKQERNLISSMMAESGQRVNEECEKMDPK